MGDGEANDLAFDVLQSTDLAAGVDEPQRERSRLRQGSRHARRRFKQRREALRQFAALEPLQFAGEPRAASALRARLAAARAPGLETKSAAPARMTEANCRCRRARSARYGMSKPASRMRASTPSPSRSGITRSSTRPSMRAPLPGEQPERGIAAVGGERAIAEARTMASSSRRCNGVVVDDEDGSGHGLQTRGCADLEHCRLRCLMAC